MTTPRATPLLLGDALVTDGLATLSSESGPVVPERLLSICHAWDDQDIDTAGTEADLGFPRADGGS